MRPFSLSNLIAERSLGLVAVAGAGALDAPIRSLHTADLDHPSRYLFPNELVLTNGLWLEHVRPEEWVDEVAAAGVSAIGFGVTEIHPEVPNGLRVACEARGLPLVRIPADVSFTTIADVVQAHTSADDVRGLRAQLARTRRLLRVLAEGGGHHGLLEALRRETGFDAAFVTPGGRVLAAVGESPRAETAREAARALRRGTLPYPLGDDLAAFGLGGAKPRASALVVRSSLASLRDEARLAIEQVVGYAALEDERLRAREASREALANELVQLAWVGDLPPSTYVARLQALGFDPAAAVVTVASSNDRGALVDAAAATEVPHALAELEGAITLVLLQPPDEPAAVEQMADQLAWAGEEPVLGVGRPVSNAADLRFAVAEAIAAHERARISPGRVRVVRRPQIGSHSLLLQFLDQRILAAYGESVLAPLEEWDRLHKTELISTLQVFLESGGRWRQTARELHVHTNTLRYRLERVEELTGRRIDSTADRVDLWLALASRADR